MGDSTAIAWTDHTFNPWMGCTKVSPGCDHCYAETLTTVRMGLNVWGPKATRQVTSPGYWRKPQQWNRPRACGVAECAWNDAAGRPHLVFCGSLCDWAEEHPIANATRPRLWELIRSTRLLHWQLLTKRAEALPRRLPSDWGGGYENVWLGVSIESKAQAWRADYLRKIPAAVRFISYEPALGDLSDINLDGIDWVIYGGESGPGWRNHDLAWPRRMRARCAEQGVTFFYKQSAAPRTEMGIQLDGETVRAYPTPRRAA